MQWRSSFAQVEKHICSFTSKDQIEKKRFGVSLEWVHMWAVTSFRHLRARAHHPSRTMETHNDDSEPLGLLCLLTEAGVSHFVVCPAELNG